MQLCRHHHRLVHEGGFSCERISSGELEFRDPYRNLIEHAGRIPSITSSVDLIEQMQERLEDLHIDASTCVTRYDGGVIDWNMTVGALMN